MLPVEEQLKVITSGTMQIVPMDELRKKLERGVPLNVKLGVDPTSPDLHLGHAVPLRKMRQFQDLGHKVTLIIGNGTALIGDPSGRDSTRPPLTEEQVEANAKTYVAQAMKVLDPEKTTIVHNGDWLKPLDLSKMLKLMSQFNVARILEREDFHNRYTNGQSIALHEFIYPVLQAYDSVVVKADVEMGGNDQIFNLLAGRDLMRAMGMELAFTDAADFSRLAEKPLKIDSVQHKVWLQLDEQGTQAAAVTSTLMAPTAAADMEEPKTIALTRPFLFVIFDHETQSIVFLGIVNQVS